MSRMEFMLLLVAADAIPAQGPDPFEFRGHKPLLERRGQPPKTLRGNVLEPLDYGDAAGLGQPHLAHTAPEPTKYPPHEPIRLCLDVASQEWKRETLQRNRLPAIAFHLGFACRSIECGPVSRGREVRENLTSRQIELFAEL